MFNPPLFWPIFSESGIVFCVYDLVWPPIIGQSFLTSIFWPQKLKNWKSTEYRHVAYQMKAKDSRITMKICPDKWEVKWVTSGWPSLTSDDLKNWKIDNQLNIGMLHIKWKLKTAELQWKYVQTSERSNEWPQADLHWPLMTSKLSILEHMHDVYQKKAEHPRISYVTTFLFCSWPYDLSWPWFDL